MEILLLLLAPVAPHIAEELWSLTGHSGSVHQQPWPAWDSELTQEELVQIAVQVNGKLRQVIEVAAQVGQTEVESLAMEQAKVQPYIAGKQITRVIYIPGKVLNIVVREPS